MFFPLGSKPSNTLHGMMSSRWPGRGAAAASRGYECLLTIPESMSLERRKLMKAFGAKILLTDAQSGMKGAISAAEELCKKEPVHAAQHPTNGGAGGEGGGRAKGAESQGVTSPKISFQNDP